jgi:hypothetical protein
MKKYEITITDDCKVIINGNYHSFDNDMDVKNSEDDLNKKVLLALANEMDYEPQFLFEEMVQCLTEMIDDNNPVKIRYYVCGIGYNENDRITDYKKTFGDFDKFPEAFKLFKDLQLIPTELFFVDEGSSGCYQIVIQIEECEETEEEINCIDVKDEFSVINPNFK